MPSRCVGSNGLFSQSFSVLHTPIKHTRALNMWLLVNNNSWYSNGTGLSLWRRKKGVSGIFLRPILLFHSNSKLTVMSSSNNNNMNIIQMIPSSELWARNLWTMSNVEKIEMMQIWHQLHGTFICTHSSGVENSNFYWIHDGLKMDSFIINRMNGLTQIERIDKKISC